MTEDLQTRYDQLVLELETILAPLEDRLAEAYITKACLTAKLEYVQSHDEFTNRLLGPWDDNPIDVRVEILERGMEVLREEFARAKKLGLVYSLN